MTTSIDRNVAANAATIPSNAPPSGAPLNRAPSGAAPPPLDEDTIALLMQSSPLLRQHLQNAGLSASSSDSSTILPRLSAGAGAQLDNMANLLGAALNNSDPYAIQALQDQWSAFIADNTANLGGMVDVAALVQHVLRESYMETTNDLAFYAQKVKYFNDLKKSIREELTRARNWAAENGLATMEDGDTLNPPYDPSTFTTGYYGDGSSNPQDVDVEELGPGASVVGLVDNDANDDGIPDDVPPELLAAMEEAGYDPADFHWVKTGAKPPEWIATNLHAHETDGNDEIFIFVPSGNAADDGQDWNCTLISGDPHVNEFQIDNDGKENYTFNDLKDDDGNLDNDWHFGQDSEFILPSGTRILINSEKGGNNEWYAEGVVIISGNDRISIGQDFDGNNHTTPHVTEDGESYYESVILAMYESVNGSSVKTGGTFALANDGQWAVLGDDGNFYDVEDQSFNDFKEDRDSGAVGDGTAIDHGTNAVIAGHNTQRYIFTKADFDAYIEELESKLQTTGDDAQLANVDLQNILQKQQQVLQMMSNISKMLYDTAMAIIRKIG